MVPPLLAAFWEAPVWPWLFWGLVGAYVLWFFVPPVFWVFRRPLQRVWFEAGMDNEWDCPIHPALANRLLDLGFEPIGTIRIWNVLAQEGWNRTHSQRLFGSPRCECFAILMAEPGEPPFIRFLSSFEGDSIVLTTNELETNEEHPLTRVEGIFTADIARLHTVHLENIGIWLASGRSPEVHKDAARLLRLFGGFCERPTWSYRLATAARECRQPALWLCLLAIALWKFGWQPFFLAGSMIAIGALALGYRKEQEQTAARYRRRAIACSMKLAAGENECKEKPDTGTAATE